MTKIIDVREDILREDRETAGEIRRRLRDAGTVMVNVMGSPGSGKTTLIVRLIAAAQGRRIAVIEGDVDSTIDAETVERAGAEAVQIRTGGFCHLDAPMVSRALEELRPGHNDFIFVENIGNLICPAEHDIGAHLSVVILSVPEGRDKPWKYPGMFRAADAVAVSKTDYPDFAGFDGPDFRGRLDLLRPGVRVFPLSARTGAGIAELGAWLEERRAAILAAPPETNAAPRT